MIKSRKTALLEGITAGFLFGTAAIFIRLLPGMGVLSIALWRLIIACGALACIILAFKKPAVSSFSRRNLKDFLILGILLGVHFILFISAVKKTSLLNAAVLVNTTPIFSMFISTFIYSMKPSKLALLGMILSFLGAGIIAIGDLRAGATGNLIGDLEATLAAVAEGFYLNYGRDKRRKLPLLATVFFIYFMAALTVGGAIVLTGTTFEFSGSFELLLPLIGLGVLPTAAAHTFYFSSLSALKSFETATMALLEPIGATLLGIAIFSEVPQPIFVIGALLVLLGIISIALSE